MHHAVHHAAPVHHAVHHAAPVHHAPAYHATKPSYHEPTYDAPAAYQYQYGVEDSYSGVNFGQNEHRDGYASTGEYHVVLPDGRTQIVSYNTADGYSGNVMDVRYEGEAHYDEYKPSHKTHAPSYHAPAPTYHAEPVYHAPAPVYQRLRSDGNTPGYSISRLSRKIS